MEMVSKWARESAARLRKCKISIGKTDICWTPLNREMGHLKAKDTNYVTQTLLGDTIVLGPKFLKELNMRPESELSSTAALVDSVLGQHNGVDLLLQDHLTSDICRGSLTRNLRKNVDMGGTNSNPRLTK